MNRRLLIGGTISLLVGSAAARLRAAEVPDGGVVTAAARSESSAAAAPPPSVMDEAARKRIDEKASRLVAALKLVDAGQAARVKVVVVDWLGVMMKWHKAHDAELGRLWGEWNKARAVVPKDEFPGEVIAHQIDGVYASLKPAYDDFIKRLSAELTPEKVDAVKENWSRSPGMTRTYNAFLEIVPDLADKDKQVIRDRMLMAREAAMLTDSDREIVSIYKRHKVKVEQYVGTLEWSKLHRAFAERGKAKSADKKSEEPAKPAAAADATPAR